MRLSVQSWWCLALFLVPVLTEASATTTTSKAPSSTVYAPAETSGTGDGKGNVVGALFNYVKTSVERTVKGCGELWTNHGRCNAIRSKIKGHRDKIRYHWEEQGLFASPNYSPKELKQQLDQLTGGITYEEFAFLQKGKEDRSKVLNLLFLVFGAPRFLPYALMFNPEMLPTPLQPPLPGTAGAPAVTPGSRLVETIFEKTSRQRSAIVLQTLLDLEKGAREVPYLSKLNLFAKKKQERKLHENHVFNQHATHFVSNHMDIPSSSSSSPASLEGAKKLLQLLHPYLVQPSQDFTRAEKRLCQVPPAIITGLCHCLTGKSFLSNFAPNAFLRGQLVGHLKRVQDADKFLSDSKIDISNISPRLLREACSERMIGGPAYTVPELQASLGDWLALISAPPPVPLEEADGSAEFSSSSAQPTIPGVYYNENLARVALLSYYGLHGTRDARNQQSALPRLLFSPKSSTSSSSTTTMSSTTNNEAKEEKSKKWGRK